MSEPSSPTLATGGFFGWGMGMALDAAVKGVAVLLFGSRTFSKILRGGGCCCVGISEGVVFVGFYPLKRSFSYNYA